MHRFLTLLLVFLSSAPFLSAAGKAEALQASRYTRVGANVRVEIGTMRTFQKSYLVADAVMVTEVSLNNQGVSSATITAISGKFVAFKQVIDQYQAQEPGYLANFTFSKEFYTVAGGKAVYIADFATLAPVPVVNVTVNPWTLKEGKNKTATFLFKLSSPAEADFILPYEFSGTAKRLSDYIPSDRSGKLKVKKGKKSAKITITLVNDKLKEPREELTVTLLPPTAGEFKLGEYDFATFVITDDDKKKK